MTVAVPVGALNVRQLRRAATNRPWTREQVATVVVADAVALAVIVVSAWNARSQSNTSTGINWLMVALLGLTVSGVVHGLFLMRARRALALGIGLVMELHRGETRTLAAAAGELVAVAGTSRFHRPDCSFVQGRAVVAPTTEQVPCEVCAP